MKKKCTADFYTLCLILGASIQDDLFLKLFLQTLGLDKWFDSTKNARVEKEYYIIDKELDEKGYIDLYISNGEKHIILENKVKSGDGDKQIAKYIGGLHTNGVKYDNIAVVYLTKNGDELSPQSRKEWSIEGNFLKWNKYKLPYKQISYGKEILEWIEKCQSKEGVGNITSLNSALEFYKDIVEIITDKKDSKMDITGFFAENAENIKEIPQEKRFKIAFEILDNRNKIIGAYLKQTAYNLSGQLKNCSVEYNDSDIPFISIKTQEYSLEKFFFYISNFGDEYMYCSILTEKISNMSNKFKEMQEFIKNNFSEVKLYQANVKAGSNKDRICFDQPNELVIDFEKINDFEKEVLNFINERIDLVNQLNKKLKNLKN